MSGTSLKPAAPPNLTPRWRIVPRTPAGLVITAAAALALLLRGYAILRPGVLLGVAWYDDGVYFASALRLVNGVLPYRDFFFAQPPGIPLLLAPAALLAKVAGTDWGMAAARILTLLASTACVVTGGLLVRHPGGAGGDRDLRAARGLPGQRDDQPHDLHRAVGGAVLPGRRPRGR